MVLARPALRAAILAQQRVYPNLLTKTEQFDNAVWAKTRCTVTANATTAPDGTSTADKLVSDATAGNTHLVNQAATTVLGPHTFFGYVKAAGFNQMQIVATGSGSILGGFVDLTTGVVSGVTAGAVTAADVGNGWYLVRGTFVGNATTLNVSFRPAAAGSSLVNGDSVSGLYLWGAMLHQGTQRQPYKAVA